MMSLPMAQQEKSGRASELVTATAAAAAAATISTYTTTTTTATSEDLLPRNLQ